MQQADLLALYSGPCELFKFVFIVAFCVFIFAYLPGRIITPYMNKLFQSESSLACVSEQSRLVGIIERSLYVILIVAGQQYIIIGWFALKALQNPFKETYSSHVEDGDSTSPPGADETTCRQRESTKLSEADFLSKKYHTIIIGNGLSLLSGVVGGIVTKQILYGLAH